MSYEIMRSIKIDKESKEVILISASNNCYPRDYTTDNNVFYKELWKEKGLEAVEKHIIGNYLSGMMQGGSNKFAQAQKKAERLFPKKYNELHAVSQDAIHEKWYKAFKNDSSMKEVKWYDSHYNTHEAEELDALHEKKIDLYHKAMNTRAPAEKKDCKVKIWNGAFIWSLYRGRALTDYDESKAMLFKKSKAKEICKKYSNYQAELVQI